LKGLNYIKGRDDPIALPEEEYPEWLWRCLDVKVKEGEVEGDEGDAFCKAIIFCAYLYCDCFYRRDTP
jgi:large subunit ribosomal protein L54